MLDASVLRHEDDGSQQMQLRTPRVATDIQQIECRHARVGSVGLVVVRVHAFRSRLFLRHAFGASLLHLSIHRLLEGVRRVGPSVGSSEGVDADLHHSRGRQSFAIGALRWLC